MATRLTNLTLKELSFVDAGANQHAKVTICKRADGETEEIVRKRLDRETALAEQVAQLAKDIEGLTPPEDRIAALQKRVAELSAQIS